MNRHRRWFQFRLRTLLAVISLVAIVLGGANLFWHFCGSYVEVESVAVGQDIQVRGRICSLPVTGSRRMFKCRVSAVAANDFTQTRCWNSAQRNGWFTYDVAVDLPPVRTPGEYSVLLEPMGGSAIKNRVAIRPR